MKFINCLLKLSRHRIGILHFHTKYRSLEENLSVLRDVLFYFSVRTCAFVFRINSPLSQMTHAYVCYSSRKQLLIKLHLCSYIVTQLFSYLFGLAQVIKQLIIQSVMVGHKQGSFVARPHKLLVVTPHICIRSEARGQECCITMSINRTCSVRLADLLMVGFSSECAV